jgi:aspartyl-tRNA synthetase
MLMVAAVERYYSLIRCFRDEDLRADRQPEFTQIHLEMSFVDRENIYFLIEGMLKSACKATLHIIIEIQLPRLSFRNAMGRFGSDKPDTRFAMEIHDLSNSFESSSFNVFASMIKNGGCVNDFHVKSLAELSQAEMKKWKISQKLSEQKAWRISR